MHKSQTNPQTTLQLIAKYYYAGVRVNLLVSVLFTDPGLSVLGF